MLINIASFAQVYAPPEGINYQAVARDTTGKPISSSINLVVRFTIWPDNSGTGTSVFTETHSPVNTNLYGLFTLVIGSANSTDFQNIVWPLGDKFLEVEIATVGGSSYTSMGITQLMSSPFALHSKTSLYSYGNWSVDGNNITNTTDFIGTTNSQDLLIKTNNTEKMRVKAAGNIGIGTSTPLSMLDVAGGVSVGSAYSGVTAAPANGVIIEGNVGIGTSSPDPAAMLHIGGQIKITGGNPGTDKILTSDATGLATWAIPDTGTVISFSANSLAPLFTTSVTNASIAPALSFTLSDAAPYTILGNGTAGNATPTYFKPILESPLFENQGTALNRVLHSNPSGNLTWGKIDNNDIANNTINLTQKVTGILPLANGGTNLSTIGSAGSIPYSNATAYGFSVAGTSGQVLTSGGTGAPTWTTPAVGTVTSVTGITPIFSTGGATPAISVANNSQSSPGVVAAGGSNLNTVWKTDGSGAPAWRNDSSASYSAGTGLSLSGTTFNSVWTQSGNDIYNNNTSNVGIGTSAPSAQLHTTGGVRFQTLTGTGVRFVVADPNGNLYPGTAPGAGGTLNYVAKFTPDGLTLGNSAIFDNGTNVGIGTAIPAAKLEVKTNAAAAGAGSFENTNSSNGSSALVGKTNSSGNALFASTTGMGNSGVITINNGSNPLEALIVSTNGLGKAGDFRITNASSTANALYVATNGTNSRGINVSHTGGSAGSTNYGAYISNTGTGSGATNIAGYFTATGGASNYAGIFDQGNVGIGTTAPAQRLTINYTGGGTAPLLIASPGGAGNTFSVTSDHRIIYSPVVTSTGGALVNFGNNLSTITSGASFMTINPLSVDATSNVLNILEGAVSRLIVDGNGNVGIGTATPLFPLDVNGRINLNNDLTVKSGANNRALLSYSGGIGGVLWMYDNSNVQTISLQAGAVSYFNGGNVGIGTTAPATNARLAIKDGHLQSQQTVVPSIGSTNSSAQNLSNATDVAGNISFSPVAISVGSVSVIFNKSYSVAPIVVLTPTNANAAADIAKIWVTTTTTSFTVNFSATFDTSAHTFSYHVVETQ